MTTPSKQSDEIDPKFQIKAPTRPPRPWRISELVAFIALALLAATLYMQHRHLQRLRTDLRNEIKAASKDADAQTSDSLDQLKKRVDLAERQIRECMNNILEKRSP